MVSVALAYELSLAGLKWQPAPGDRFIIRDRQMDDEVFVLSNMTTELHHFPSGPVIGFNGTVEWALDAVEQDAALWLPNEDQLRRLLGGTFRRLECDGSRYRVVLEIAGRLAEVMADDAADAYARALLHLITGECVGLDDVVAAPEAR